MNRSDCKLQSGVIHQCHGFFPNLAQIDRMIKEAYCHNFLQLTVVVFELWLLIGGGGGGGGRLLKSQPNLNCHMYSLSNSHYCTSSNFFSVGKILASLCLQGVNTFTI